MSLCITHETKYTYRTYITSDFAQDIASADSYFFYYESHTFDYENYNIIIMTTVGIIKEDVILLLLIFDSKNIIRK
jgi:hypothetical protein